MFQDSTSISVLSIEASSAHHQELGAQFPQHKHPLHCHSMLPPHLKHQVLQFIGRFCAADVDVELARRDNEFHNDSHQAPSL